MPGRVLRIAVVLLLTGLAPALAQSDDPKALKSKAQQPIPTQTGEAMDAGQRAPEIDEATLGKNPVEVAESLARLARMHIERGQPGNAEPLDKRAIELMETAHGPDHPSLAEFLVKIANRHVHERFAYAEPLYKRALGIYEKAWANDPR